METHSKHFFEDAHHSQLRKGCEVIIVTDNFSTPENIGSIIRLAANVNATKVLVVGSADCRQSKIKKTAGAAIGHVEVEYCNYDNLKLSEEFQLIALETVKGAQSIYDHKMPIKMALVLGNEKFGVSNELLTQCKSSVYIPMPGKIKSMNVSQAATACLFEWLRQSIL